MAETALINGVFSSREDAFNSVVEALTDSSIITPQLDLRAFKSDVLSHHIKAIPTGYQVDGSAELLSEVAKLHTYDTLRYFSGCASYDGNNPKVKAHVELWNANQPNEADEIIDQAGLALIPLENTEFGVIYRVHKKQ